MTSYSRSNQTKEKKQMIEHVKENPQKAELKERIVKIATEAFLANGIKRITMDDIAATLGISKRTLYEVFPDKEALLIECLLKREEEEEVYMKTVMGRANNVLEVILIVFEKSIEDFHATSRRFFEDVKKYPKVHEMMKKKHEIDSDSTIAFFKTGVEQGIFRPDVNFKISNLLMREQFVLLLNTDICKEYPFIEVYESIMFTYIRGIATEKGATVLDEFIRKYRRNSSKQDEN